MEIILVKQEDSHGCGLAVLAMLTGKTYADVKTDIMKHRPKYEDDRFSKRGINYLQIEAYLAKQGFAVARKTLFDPITNRKRKFPPKPFADVHYCEVEQHSGNYHFIVWLRNGRILDPLSDERKTFADYKSVQSATAVVKIK